MKTFCSLSLLTKNIITQYVNAFIFVAHWSLARLSTPGSEMVLKILYTIKATLLGPFLILSLYHSVGGRISPNNKIFII